MSKEQRAKDLFLNNQYCNQSKLVNHLLEEGVVEYIGPLYPEGEVVLEWHSVSTWLAGRLHEHDEVILNFQGERWWGRTTTGQSAWQDHVIKEIYDEWQEEVDVGKIKEVI